MGDLLLARHGETEWSRTGRHTGRTDLPLTPRGEAQAESLAPLLAGRSFGLVLTSPLVRARHTAQLAGLTGAEPEPGLRERRRQAAPATRSRTDGAVTLRHAVPTERILSNLKAMRHPRHGEPAPYTEVWTGRATGRFQWLLALIGAACMALGIALAVDSAWTTGAAPLGMAGVGCIAAG
ncbi:histidine phosphatase family protein, partial [Streptomyces sp. NPDC004976]